MDDAETHLDLAIYVPLWVCVMDPVVSKLNFFYYLKFVLHPMYHVHAI
jgi:hypothetical protein